MIRLTWPKIARSRVVEEFYGSAPRKHRIILVCFDTAGVERINKRRVEVESKMIFPAKYAAYPIFGADDNGSIAECLLFFDDYKEQAIWFNQLIDLPLVIERLRARKPEVTYPDHIEWIIDYPFDRNARDAGSSIVKSIEKMST